VTASDFVLLLKTTQQPLQKIQSQETKRKFCRTQSFDSSDDVFINARPICQWNNNNDSENNTKEKHNRELPGRHGGDIEGIIKTDYIASLGATAI
jgi:hypothetical protein